MFYFMIQAKLLRLQKQLKIKISGLIEVINNFKKSIVWWINWALWLDLVVVIGIKVYCGKVKELKIKTWLQWQGFENKN